MDIDEIIEKYVDVEKIAKWIFDTEGLCGTINIGNKTINKSGLLIDIISESLSMKLFSVSSISVIIPANSPFSGRIHCFSQVYTNLW